MHMWSRKKGAYLCLFVVEFAIVDPHENTGEILWIYAVLVGNLSSNTSAEMEICNCAQNENLGR